MRYQTKSSRTSTPTKRTMATRKRSMSAPTKRTMPARKCRRTCGTTPVPELPACLLLEIAARTDAATIFRCAATCKLLRREMLSDDFRRRVCEGPGAVVPSRTLGVLGETAFSVVHPVTAATKTLETNCLAPFMSRSGSIVAAGLLEQYEPQTSRNGLVVLSRRVINRRRRSERRSDLCVYDPMTNSRAFLPFAPDIDRDVNGGCASHCALLTAADGIGCSFMLVAADMDTNLDWDRNLDRDRNLDCRCRWSTRVRVQTVCSSGSDTGGGGAQWSTVKTTNDHRCPWWCLRCNSTDVAAVVVGVVVYWLMHSPDHWTLSEDDVDDYILTYDVKTAALGSVDIPKPRGSRSSSSQLASSPDGKLSFVATQQCTVSVWVLSSGGTWARHVEIDMMAEWGQLLGLEPWLDHRLELESFGDQRSGAVFLHFGGVHFVLDMETGAMSRRSLTRETGIPYEVDLASRFASMKSF